MTEVSGSVSRHRQNLGGRLRRRREGWSRGNHLSSVLAVARFSRSPPQHYFYKHFADAFVFVKVQNEEAERRLRGVEPILLASMINGLWHECAFCGLQ